MRVLGVVLSGGKSRRMGTDKAALRHLGQSWLERTEALLRDAGVDEVRISGRPEGIADMFPDAGPVGGIASVIEASEAFDLFVFVPVDMPHLLPAHLMALMGAARSGNTAACYEGSPLPLAIARNAVLEAAVNAFKADISDGDVWSVKALLSRLNAVRLPPPTCAALDNINTPEELSLLDAPACALIRVAKTGKPEKKDATTYLKARLADVGYGLCREYTASEDVDDIRRTLKIAMADGATTIISLGGTGPGRYDVTPEAIEPLLDKRFEGFSVLFHMYSHQSAGLPAMLSRAFAGTIGDTLVFGLPSSLGAVTDAWENILHYHLSSDPTACSLRRVVTPKSPRQ